MLPAYGLFARHVNNLKVRDLEYRTLSGDQRPALFIQDVDGAYFDHLTAPHASDSPTFSLRDVSGLTLLNSRSQAELRREEKIGNETL